LHLSTYAFRPPWDKGNTRYIAESYPEPRRSGVITNRVFRDLNYLSDSDSWFSAAGMLRGGVRLVIADVIARRHAAASGEEPVTSVAVRAASR